MRSSATRIPFAVSLLALAAAAHAADSVPVPSSAPVPKGAYEIDKSHTSLLFRVSHMGFSEFTGRFTRLDAQLAFDPARLGSSSVNVTIDPKSIASDNAPDGFLDILTGEQFLNAAKYPEMKFVSRAVEAVDAHKFRIRGDLTLNGVTRPLVLEARYNGGYAGHPYDPRARIGFSARGTLKRSDFGVSMGIPTAASPLGVGDEVQVQLETEFSGPALGGAQR